MTLREVGNGCINFTSNYTLFSPYLQLILGYLQEKQRATLSETKSSRDDIGLIAVWTSGFSISYLSCFEYPITELFQHFVVGFNLHISVTSARRSPAEGLYTRCGGVDSSQVLFNFCKSVEEIHHLELKCLFE